MPTKREKAQNSVVKILLDAYSKNDHPILLEAPTGFGKSYIIAKMSKELVKSGRVIVSTSTNKLAYELESTLKKVIPDAKIGVVFGKDNYIDINKLKENRDALSQFCEGVSAYVEEMEKNKDTLEGRVWWLVDTFIEETLKDTDMEKPVRELIKADERIKQAGNFSDYDIAVTNHFYLLSNFLFKNNSSAMFQGDLENYHIILDEVHTVPIVADTLFAKSFSPYRLSWLITRFLDNVGNHITKKLSQSLTNLSAKMSAFAKSHARKDRIGSYFRHDSEEYRQFVADLREVISQKQFSSESLLSPLRRILSKAVQENVRLPHIYDLIQELEEMMSVAGKRGNLGYLRYSPSRGYPSIEFSRVDAKRELQRSFWSVKPRIIGMSATVYVDRNRQEESAKQVLSLPRNMGVFLYPVAYSWGKNQVTYLPPRDMDIPQPPNIGGMYDMTDEDKDRMDRWAGYVAKVVASTFEDKKSLVLTGSYMQVNAVYNALLKHVNEEKMVISAPDKTMRNVLNMFEKRHVKILIAVRHYGIGVDLPGNKLEKLYIARLPFPVITLKWLNSKNYMLYEGEMIINFRQWMGRLLRTPEDRGEFYVLDHRIYDGDRFKKLKPFIEERSSEIKTFEEVLR